MTTRLVRFVAVFFVVALAALPARAEGKRDKGQKPVDQGHRAYNLGHWADALTLFEKAYEDSGDSALLFNLAETHRQLGHTADAIRLYNSYLREQPNGPEHEAAATEIKNLSGNGAAKAPPAATAPPPMTPPPARPVASPPPPPPPAPARPAPPPPARPAPPPPAPPPPAATNPWPPPAPPPPAAAAPPPGSAPVAPLGPAPTVTSAPPGAPPPATDTSLLVSQPPPPAQHKSKVPVIIGAAATGAFVAGAIAFTLSSNSLYNDLKSSCGVTAMGCSQSQVDGVKTRDHAATAFWIAAGVAAVATSVLLIVRF
jgi:hypothetical protein